MFRATNLVVPLHFNVYQVYTLYPEQRQGIAKLEVGPYAMSQLLISSFITLDPIQLVLKIQAQNKLSTAKKAARCDAIAAIAVGCPFGSQLIRNIRKNTDLMTTQLTQTVCPSAVNSSIDSPLRDSHGCYDITTDAANTHNCCCSSMTCCQNPHV